jgi:hypothetical protein
LASARVLKNLAAQSHISIRTLVIICLQCKGKSVRSRQVLYSGAYSGEYSEKYSETAALRAPRSPLSSE